MQEIILIFIFIKILSSSRKILVPQLNRSLFQEANRKRFKKRMILNTLNKKRKTVKSTHFVNDKNRNQNSA